jgi:thiamine pyrophosphate-dependent acetolactate synthase large subunit-like protein
MAWSRAEDEVRAFIERTQIPFLRSPMGKGVMPDDLRCRSRRRAPWPCRTRTSSS